MRAGVEREAALKSLAARTGLEDIRGLVSLLVQTLKFGTSIGETLRVYAEEFRDKRMQRAEELAAKIGTKLIFPLVFCLFPSFFVVADRSGGRPHRRGIPVPGRERCELRRQPMVVDRKPDPCRSSLARAGICGLALLPAAPARQTCSGRRAARGNRTAAGELYAGQPPVVHATEFPVESAAEGVARGDKAWRAGKLDLAVYLYVQSLAYDATSRRRS